MQWPKFNVLAVNNTRRTERRIALILLGIFLLPAIAFSVFELNQLNENEAIIQEIYKDQLDAILFSINQYSNDILDQWTKEFNNVTAPPYSEEKVIEFMEFNPAISKVSFFSAPLSQAKGNVMSFFEDSTGFQQDVKTDSLFNKLIKDNNATFDKLLEFIENDYQKIEVLASENDSLLPMIFALKTPFKAYNFCSFMVNPQFFVEEVMAPKIQEVARDEFIITSYVKRAASSTQLYTTDSINIDEIVLSRALWLLPNHYLGINLKGNSIDKIVQARTNRNIIILLIIDAFLVVAIWLVYRNIRKEILLAQLKSEFVSNVSHEIRTPLAMISMFGETLFEGRVLNEEKKKSYYKMITEEADRLNKTVDKILNFSKIESGKRRFNFEPTDLQQLTEDCLKAYQSQFKLNNFSCNYKKHDVLPIVMADKEALTEAINNLIDNAIKYSKQKKEIILESQFKNNKVVLSIQDFGIGIHEKFQKDIFSKFYRVPNNDVHDTKGTGLGLTLVKYIIDAHNGEITLRSTENKGSTFSLAFPVKNEAI
ncbi:MAG: HAMP domain-containing sensor histidine kinase [Bacteroidota bacterium]